MKRSVLRHGIGWTLGAVLVGALIYLPVLLAWINRWPSYASMLGDRAVDVVQVDLSPVMRFAGGIYRPLLRLHARVLGWYPASIADGDPHGERALQFHRFVFPRPDDR